MNGLSKVWDGRGDGSSKSKASKTTQHDILFFSVYIYISYPHFQTRHTINNFQ